MSKILIIDDNVDFAEFLSEFLKREGYETFSVHDGHKAIEHLDAGNQYDVIITDMIMPNMDGIGFLHYLNKTGINVPTLVLSGGGITMKPEDALKTVEHLVAGTFSKPVDYQKLLDKINQLLEQTETV